MSKTVQAIKVANDSYFVPDEETVAFLEKYGIREPGAQHQLFDEFAEVLRLADLADQRRSAVERRVSESGSINHRS